MPQFSAMIESGTMKPCAFFSTHGGIYEPRDCSEPKPDPIVYSDRREAVREYIRELRTKWPHICNAIFADWQIHWFFDEYDFVLRGPHFLFEVLNKIVRENEERVIDISISWSTQQQTQFHLFPDIVAGKTGILGAFHQSDIDQLGIPFLEKVLQHITNAYIKACNDTERDTRQYKVHRYPSGEKSLVPADLANVAMIPSFSNLPSVHSIKGALGITSDIVRQSPRISYVPPHGSAHTLVMEPQQFRKRRSDNPLRINTQIPTHFDSPVSNTFLPSHESHTSSGYTRPPGQQRLLDTSIIYVAPHASVSYGLQAQTGLNQAQSGPVQHKPYIFSFPMDAPNSARNIPMSSIKNDNVGRCASARHEFAPFDRCLNGPVSSGELWQDPDARPSHQNYNTRGNRGRRNSGGRGGRGVYGGHHNSFTRRSSLSHGESMERDRVNGERRRGSINDRDVQWKGENFHKATNGFPNPHLPLVIKEETMLHISDRMRTTSGPARMSDSGMARNFDGNQSIQISSHDPVPTASNKHLYPQDAIQTDVKNRMQKITDPNTTQQPTRLISRSLEIRSGYIGEAVDGLDTLWVRIFPGATESDIQAAFDTVALCIRIIVNREKNYAFVTFPSTDVARKVVQQRFFECNGHQLEARVPIRHITHDEKGNPTFVRDDGSRMTDESPRAKANLSVQHSQAYCNAFEDSKSKADQKAEPRKNTNEQAITYSKQDARSSSMTIAAVAVATNDVALDKPASLDVPAIAQVSNATPVPESIHVPANKSVSTPITWAIIASKNIPTTSNQEAKSIQRDSPDSATTYRSFSTPDNKSKEDVSMTHKTPTKGSRPIPSSDHSLSTPDNKTNEVVLVTHNTPIQGSRPLPSPVHSLPTPDNKSKDDASMTQKTPTKGPRSLPNVEQVTPSRLGKEANRDDFNLETLKEGLVSSSTSVTEPELFERQCVHVLSRGYYSVKTGTRKPYYKLAKPETKPSATDVCALTQPKLVLTKPGEETYTEKLKPMVIVPIAIPYHARTIKTKQRDEEGHTSVTPSEIIPEDSETIEAVPDSEEQASILTSSSTTSHVILTKSDLPTMSEIPRVTITTVDESPLIDCEATTATEMVRDTSPTSMDKKTTKVQGIRPQITSANSKAALAKLDLKDWEKEYYSILDCIRGIPDTEKDYWLDQTKTKRAVLVELEDSIFKLSQKMGNGTKSIKKKSRANYEKLVPKYKEALLDIYVLEGKMNALKERYDEATQKLQKSMEKKVDGDIEVKKTSYPQFHQESASFCAVDYSRRGKLEQSFNAAHGKPRNKQTPDESEWSDTEDDGGSILPSIFQVLDDNRRRVQLPPLMNNQGQLITGRRLQLAPDGENFLFVDSGVEEKTLDDLIDEGREVHMAGYRSTSSSPVRAEVGTFQNQQSHSPTDSDRTISLEGARSEDSQNSSVNVTGLGLSDVSGMVTLPTTRSMSPVSPHASPSRPPYCFRPTSPPLRPSSMVPTRPDSPHETSSSSRGRTILLTGPKSYASAAAASVKQTKSSNNLEPAHDGNRRASLAAKATSVRPVVHLPTSAGNSRRNSAVKGEEGKGGNDDWKPGPEGVWGKEGFMRRGG